MDLIDHLRTMVRQYEHGVTGAHEVEARLWELLITRAEDLAAREQAPNPGPSLAELEAPPAWWLELRDADA